jgi:RNA polymerase sigma-70 factor (ECF subfamily)
MNTNYSEDFDFIDRFLSGEEAAFDALVKKYQNYVVNIVYSLLGVNTSAEDIAQEVFIKVYQNLDTFEKKSSFSTWLYRITINTSYNHIKSRKAHLPLEELGELTDIREIAVEHMENRERQQIINKAIQNMPFKYRTVLVLKDIEGLSYQDIAKTLNCPLGTVESRLARARDILKKILAPLLKREEML